MQENITTEQRELVRWAINRLDAHGPRNWRAKTDTDTLDLVNGSSCILGQIYGDYYNGKADEFKDKDCPTCKPWSEVSPAFDDRDYHAAWVEALGLTETAKVLPKVGETWHSLNSQETISVLSVYEDDGTRVVYRYPSGGRYDRPLSDFLGAWQAESPKPKYVVGGLYTPKDGPRQHKNGSYSALILMCSSKGDGGYYTFQGLAASGENYDDGIVTQVSPESFWVRRHGELIPVNFASADDTLKSHKGQQVVVTIDS